MIFDYSTNIVPGAAIKCTWWGSEGKPEILHGVNDLFLDHLLSLTHRTLTVSFDDLIPSVSKVWRSTSLVNLPFSVRQH